MSGVDHAQRLSELVAVCDRIGSNLFELDTHPTVELLRVSELRGVTATRWNDATQTIAELFAAHAALRAVLDDARRILSERPYTSATAGEMHALLDGPSVAVTDDAKQLAERSLTATSRVVVRRKPDDLIVAMTADFEAVQTFVVDVDRIWSEMVPDLRDARRCEIELTAGDGDVLDAELGDVRRQLRALSEDVLSDPLSVERDRLASILARLSRAEQEITELRDLREHREQYFDAARQLLHDAELAVAACQDTVSAVRTRIVLDHPVQPPSLPSCSEDELARIAASSDGDRSLAARLRQWRDTVDEARAEADRTRGACQALLDERDELRARLEAYQAKAAVLGRLEVESLGRAHEHARSVLFTAPTDIAVARRAVAEYQRLLAAPGIAEVAT